MPSSLDGLPAGSIIAPAGSIIQLWLMLQDACGTLVVVWAFGPVQSSARFGHVQDERWLLV